MMHQINLNLILTCPESESFQ